MFFGSAKQPNLNCVQNRFNEALKTIGVFSEALFASRTDKGVHALCNVACIKSVYKLNLTFAKNKLNKILDGIYIKSIKEVSSNFEVRFDVKTRAYRYIISNNFNAFNKKYLCYYDKKINIKLLKQALNILQNEYDFSSFSLSNDKKNKIRKMYKCRIYNYKDYTVINFFANGFLRGQIRLIVDFLLKINENKLSLEDFKQQLLNIKTHSRTLANAGGLYLKSVSYI